MLGCNRGKWRSSFLKRRFRRLKPLGSTLGIMELRLILEVFIANVGVGAGTTDGGAGAMDAIKSISRFVFFSFPYWML